MITGDKPLLVCFFKKIVVTAKAKSDGLTFRDFPYSKPMINKEYEVINNKCSP